MEGYNNSYQNSSSARETEFQRLAQNIGTNIQKIQQNGECEWYNKSWIDKGGVKENWYITQNFMFQ